MGNFTNWVKFISADSSSISIIDSSNKISELYNGTENALIFDNTAKVLYFLDAGTNNGKAQKINATTEHPLYIIDGSNNVLTYTGANDVSIDSSLLHKKYSIDSDLFITKYDIQSGSLLCPCLTIDKSGHIINTNYVNLHITGDSDSSLVTVAKTKVLFAEYASQFEVKVCGKGSTVGYVIPDTTTTGTSWKCVDAHEYYYSDGVTLIQYRDDQGNLKNPGAGDIIICDKVNPLHWNVIVNKYDLYSDIVTGLVPAYGDASNAILYAKDQWGYLNGNKGIKVVNNKTIEHINDISSGTIGQQYDQSGQPVDELEIPHAVKTQSANPYFTIAVPKITYDEEGHITTVKDSSVTIEVSKIVGGDYPYLKINYIDSSFISKSYTYDPNNSDVSVDLSDIRAKSAIDSSKLAGRTVTTSINDFISKTDTVIPTAGITATFVETYVSSTTDSSLSLDSSNAIQNKVVYAEILKRDACVYERIEEEREYLDSSLELKADKINVIEKDSSVIYVPTENYHPTNKIYVDTADTSLRLGKQDKLIPGPGVVIDNSIIGPIIKFRTDMFIVLDSSVIKNASDNYIRDISLKVTDPEENKIYLWRLYDPSEGSTSTPTYLEFSYEFNIEPKHWVELGRFRLDFLIDRRLDEIDASIKDLKEEHVFLTEDEWEIIKPYQNPEKIYFTYESEGPSGGIEADVSGNILKLTGSGVSTLDDVLVLTGDASVIGETLII